MEDDYDKIYYDVSDEEDNAIAYLDIENGILYVYTDNIGNINCNTDITISFENDSECNISLIINRGYDIILNVPSNSILKINRYAEYGENCELNITGGGKVYYATSITGYNRATINEDTTIKTTVNFDVVKYDFCTYDSENQEWYALPVNKSFTTGEQISHTFTEDEEGYMFYKFRLYYNQNDYLNTESFMINWTKGNVETYTISFNANGGTGSMDNEVVADDEEYYLSDCGYVPPMGKKFIGWKDNLASEKIYTNNEKYGLLTSDTEFFAIWEDITYTVSFNANGGTGTMANVENIFGNYYLPDCTFTAPEGKEFKGWSTSANGIVLDEKYNINSNTEFFAIWNEIAKQPEQHKQPKEDIQNKDDNKKMSPAAVVFIVIAIIVVFAIAGFMVFWFFIKKKNFADLIAIFKK